MRIDITSLCFGFKIEKPNDNGTPAWATSIGQAPKDICYVDTKIEGLSEFIFGMMYKSHSDFENLKVRDVEGIEKKEEPRGDRERMMFSVFDEVYINNKKVDGIYTITFEREDTPSHKNRLHICYAKYLTYDGHSNKETLLKMAEAIGCGTEACWFVSDINIRNQKELHFKAYVVNSESSENYKDSAERKQVWEQIILNNTPFEKPIQMIYFGAPGSGKSWKIRQDYEMRKDGAKYVEDKEKKERVYRTTFHPDTDYSSFVGCYKPIMDKEHDNHIIYKFSPQIFVNAYVAAWRGSEMYYLVIEEINRGNCAQIFGDLFQLLDRDENGFSRYPICADEDLKEYLEEILPAGSRGIRDGKLCLPPNLSIIASMNTSDQSLFPMDSAFKRRWSWEYVPIKYDDTKSATFLINIPNTPYEKWVDFLKKINGIILEKTDSEDKQMGNFFIKGDVEEQEFKDKVMFYLWSEVCKDSFHTKDNFFRTKDREFSYNELYGDEGHDLLVGFLDYIKNYKAKDDQTV